MNLKDYPELQAAILAMPQKKKDSLLFRLIRKDKLLVEQLHYRLLENENDLEKRTEELKNTIRLSLLDKKEAIKATSTSAGFKILNSTFRTLHGQIGHHEKVTRDLLSDVDCRIYAMLLLFENYPEYFGKTLLKIGERFHKYVVGRVTHLLKKYDKLHEDYQFDVYEDILFIQNFAAEIGESEAK